jgi:RNA polymerase sigma-70 factor (ECF subfamily)
MTDLPSSASGLLCDAIVPHRLSDRALLKHFQQGNEDAATSLYLRYVKRVRALARNQCSPELARCVDLDDLVQSVFGSFFRGVRKGRYDVPDGEELWRLFLVIAINKIRARAAYHHAAKRDVRRAANAHAYAQALENLEQDEAGQVFLRMTIKEALERLPPEPRRLVQLRMQGYEVAEMARLTGRSNRTVERLLQDARKQLSRYLT